MNKLNVAENNLEDHDECQGLNTTIKSNKWLKFNLEEAPTTFLSSFMLQFFSGKRNIIFYIVVTLIITVVGYIFYILLYQLQIPKCFTLNQYSNSRLINSTYSKSCQDNCQICMSYLNQRCLQCSQSFKLHDSICVKDCPKGFKNYQNQCLRKDYSLKLLEINKLHSLLIEDFVFTYLQHRSQNINLNSITLLVVIRDTSMPDKQYNWQQIANSTESMVLEFYVPFQLSLRYEEECGKNLFSQFIIDEFIPEILKRNNIIGIRTIIFLGYELSTNEAIELGVHIEQLKQVIKSKTKQDQPYTIKYNNINWINLVEPFFKVGVVGLYPDFAKIIYIKDEQAILQTMDLVDFMSDQMEINYSNLEVVVYQSAISIYGETSLKHQIITYNKDFREEELISSYMNYVSRQQVQFFN